MGKNNSSETRVRPVINELLDRQWRDPAFAVRWLPDLWQLAEGREGPVTPVPDCGTLLTSEAPSETHRRLSTVFERRVPPPATLLAWMLSHSSELTGKGRKDPAFGCRPGSSSYGWRKQLFDGSVAERAKAAAEGLALLTRRGALGSRSAWWAFEGFTAVDCCLISDKAVLLIEGKRTERVSGNVLWYPQRNQIWRNVEAAQTLAQGKSFGVILGVEFDQDGKREVAAALASLDASCPHLTTAARESLASHLLGYVTWKGSVRTAFDLPETCFPESTDDLANSANR